MAGGKIERVNYFKICLVNYGSYLLNRTYISCADHSKLSSEHVVSFVARNEPT
jgi:hypothetical protein